MCLQLQQTMMIVLLLLCAFVSPGLSDEELLYGETFRITLDRRTQTLEFAKNHGSFWKTIWNRDNPSANKDSRHVVMNSYFKIESVAQRDSGVYQQKDRSGRYLTSETLVVEPYTRYERRNSGESLDIEFELKPDSCNIYFFPEPEFEIEVVRWGRLVSYYENVCTGLEMSAQCGITNYNLEMSCNGRFEVRDKLDNKALVVILKMESSEPDFEVSSIIGTALGIFFIVFGCCCCLKHCCCSKSSSKKNKSESPDSEPAPDANYLTYDREPAAPRREQPSETLHPALPSYNPSRPLIHNPPARAPPAYSEVFDTAAVGEDAPTVPVLAEDHGPRFELSFATEMPLSSDVNPCHVYTSDKLNF